MQLKKYLEEQSISQKLFAEKLGVHLLTIFKITNKKSMPSLKLALKIENLTFGKVTCEDFLEPDLQEEGKKKQRRKSKNRDDKLELGVSTKAGDKFIQDGSHVKPLVEKKKDLK